MYKSATPTHYDTYDAPSKAATSRLKVETPVKLVIVELIGSFWSDSNTERTISMGRTLPGEKDNALYGKNTKNVNQSGLK